MGVFEQALGKALLGSGGFVPHHARQQPDAGVDQCHRRDLAARQHVVADRNFLQAARIDDALVDALEPAADDQGSRAA